MDIAAGICAGQRAQGRVATVAIDAMKFIRPVSVGDVLCVCSEVVKVGRTSLEIHLEAWVLKGRMGKRVKVTDGLFTFVAIDADRNSNPGSIMSRSVIEEWNNVEPPPLPAIKTVTVDPSKTAFLLLDFLRKVCTPEFRPRAAAALPGLQAFLKDARRRGLVIVHTVTSNEEPSGHELADELQPMGGEPVYSGSLDKFHDNELAQFLRSRGIDTVIVTGTSANGCFLFTTAGALLRGFSAIVPVDGMPAKTLYQEQFVAWQIANGPGGFGRASVLTRLDAIRFKD